MIELRNSKKTYLGKLPDGRKRWALDASIIAMQFRENGGSWVDIDSSVEGDDTDGFSVKFTQVPYLGRIALDSRRRIYPDRTNLNAWIEFRKPFVNMPPPSRHDRWFYWDFPNALMGVRFDSTSIKFGFKLKNSNAPSSITIPFETHGITRSGRFLLVNGKVIGMLRKPLAMDANGELRECSVNFGDGEVTVSLDPSGLTYPIEIDPTVDFQVDVGLNDINEVEDVGEMKNLGGAWLQSSTLATQRWWGGFRWVSGDLPTLGSTIDVAHASFFVNKVFGDDINGNFHFEKATSPAQFTTNDFNITDRTRTTASVEWIEDNIAAADEGWFDTPSLVTPLQEVIDLYSPTSLALIFRPNQDSYKWLVAYTYEIQPSQAAKIHLEWTESWLPGFTGRKKFEIDGTTAGVQTLYQKMLFVHKGAGSDSGNHVYLDGECRDDFNDIRFTSEDKLTELDHCRISYVSGDYAIFWIEFDSIPADPDSGTYYIYFGNAGADSASSGVATFLVFDDFSSGGGLWTIKSGTWEVDENDRLYYSAGTKSNIIYTQTTVPTNYRAVAKLVNLVGSAGNAYPAIGDYVVNDYFVGGHKQPGVDGGIGTVRVTSEDVFTVDQAAGVTPAEGEIEEFTKHEDDMVTTLYTVAWVEREHRDRTDSDFEQTGKFAVHGYGGRASYLAWIFLAKFVYPEPPWGAWEEEEEEAIDLALTDGMKMSDSNKGSLVIGLSLVDGMKGGDSAGNQVVLEALVTDAIKLSDLPATVGGAIYDLLLAEGAKLGDAPSMGLTHNPVVIDGMKLGDTLLGQTIFNAILTEGIKLGDAPFIVIATTDVIYIATLRAKRDDTATLEAGHDDVAELTAGREYTATLEAL